jgi:group I intron endonuclease
VSDFFNRGVYRWLNKVNGKSYIGSSVNIRRRQREHIRELIAGIHANAKLQHAWNKYGSAAFEFEMLAFCPEEDLLWQEQMAINAFDAVRSGYNIALYADAPQRGRKASLETREKQSRAGKGRPKSKEHVEKIAAANRGRIASAATRKLWSEQRRGKISEAQRKSLAKGRITLSSPEHRKKTGEISKLVWQRPEVRTKREARARADRENALALYLKAPKHCAICGSAIMPTHSRSGCFADMPKRIHCSRACANKVKNAATCLKKEKAASAAA